jgi:hypothetical protein
VAFHITLSPQRKYLCDCPLPEIARFFGIVIRMFAEPGAPHHRPHFHAYYQGATAVYGLDEIEIIGGGLPRRQQRFVEAWTELHRNELMANWDRLQNGRSPEEIAPLR